MSLGRHITIERKLNSADFYCRFQVTGDLFQAHVRNDYRELFAGTTERESHPGWCPFLRSTGTAEFVCTIYDTAPRFCREFRCATMVIRDPEGNVAGRVKGRRSLDTVDRVLAAIWEEHISGSCPENEQEFLSLVTRVLDGYGYRAEPVE